MVLIAVECPYCHSPHVGKGGKTSTGKQRYRCQNNACAHWTFLVDYRYRGRQPAIKAQIAEMAVNGSGVRDTARVLRISKDTVLSELKKKRTASNQSIPLC